MTQQSFDQIRTLAAELIPDVNRLSDVPLDKLVQTYMGMRPRLEGMEPGIIKLPHPPKKE